MTSNKKSPAHWWGNHNLNVDQSKQWQIGPLTFIVRNLVGEWQIAYERDEAFDENDTNWEVKNTDRLTASLDDNSRYILSDSTEQLTITPLLADRPIISRPSTPFNLTAGEDVTLYVSSPLWIELAIGCTPKKPLKEISIQRPSDTWFGPSTREGELCYASTTHCLIKLNELPKRHHRAITPVLIRNRAETTLSLERLNLPVLLLPLFADSNSQLWTPKVTLTREKEGDIAEMTIDKYPPDEAKNATLLSGPRIKTTHNPLIRAFNAVFS